MMWTVFSLLLVSSVFVLKILHGTWTKDHDGGGKKPDSPNCYRGRCSENLHEGEALQCYTCVGSSDDDCNRQGTQQCPGHSDACAVFRGQASGVMKSCSFRSFCERARRDGSRAPGVSVHCCYSNNCNAKSLGSRVTISTSYIPLLIFTLLWHPLLKVT